MIYYTGVATSRRNYL